MSEKKAGDKCGCCNVHKLVAVRALVCRVCDAVPSWPSQRGGTR